MAARAVARAGAGYLWANGEHDADHEVRLEAHGGEPPDDRAEWDDVMETPSRSLTGTVALTHLEDSGDDADTLLLGSPGHYRVRVSCRRQPAPEEPEEREAAEDQDVWGGHTWYLQFWVAPGDREPPRWLARALAVPDESPGMTTGRFTHGSQCVPGDHSQSLRHARHALRLYRAAGDLGGQAAALNGIGWGLALLGHHERALRYCGKALDLHRESGNRFGEAATLDSLGCCCHQAGRPAHAVGLYQQAVRAYADVGDRYYRAQTLIRLGDAQQAGGHPESTRAAWQQALSILDDMHHPDADPVRAKLKDMIVTG